MLSYVTEVTSEWKQGHNVNLQSHVPSFPPCSPNTHSAAEVEDKPKGRWGSPREAAVSVTEPLPWEHRGNKPVPGSTE